MEKPTTLKFSRRNLPHWLVADRSFFVTIRLKNTLPKSVMSEMQKERTDELSEKQRIDLSRKHFLKIEKILDSSTGESRFLDQPNVAELLVENLEWLRKRGWIIYAGVVLSTHMHLLMRNTEGRSVELLTDLGQYKNFTARAANRLLGREGAFWAREDFDHWIRTPDKFEAAVRYIANNPVKAGRVLRWDDWAWTVIHEDVLYCLDEKKSTL